MAIELPEDPNSLDDDALEAAINEALDAWNAIDITDDMSDEALEEAEATRDALDTLSKVRKDRARRAALREPVEVPEAVEETPEPEAPAAEEAPEVEATPEVATEPVAEVTEEAEVEVAEETPEPVLASGEDEGTALERAAAAAPEIVAPAAAPAAVLVAAADVPNFATGQELDGLDQATQAILSKTRGLPRINLATAQGGVRQRYGAALIKKATDPDLTQSQDEFGDYALVQRATDESRLEGGSLVAAGGWCAPSETLYDLCQTETLAGILSLSEFTVRRGGIRYTQGPSFDDIYTACGFEQTEAEAIAGDCKDCCTVDCPPFSEIRMDVIGLCVKSPILTEHAYPELVRRFVEGSLVAHAHKVNKYILDAITLAAGAAVAAQDGGSLTKSLNGIALTAVGMRYQHRLALDAVIEVVLPFFFRELLRADLALENNRPNKNVSNAEIDAWFTSRNLAVQWVYDFQDPTVTNCSWNVPATVTALMYPAGTWSRGAADVIQMDAVYDSPNLEANQYTALFVEEGILAVQRCTHTCAVDIPICISGRGVIEDIDVCLVTPGQTPTNTV